MLKFLECPDLHFDAEWLEMFYIWRNEILKQAKEQKVDYIAIPADLFKGVITNDNKGGLPLLLEFITEAVRICPVCAIEGTPSHDSPGSYEALTYAGLVLLEPGKVYGYWKSFKQIIELESDTSMDSILFGVPELTKNNIHAQLNLSSEEANGKAVELLENYMDSFISPMRLKYKDLPAHLLFHGNVSDSSKENNTDIIMKSSDIVIHSDVFAKANLTRVSLGHIHKPWESEKCNMGYSGSPGLKWGERGFIPSMTLVTDGKLTRLPYGTPERKKIYKTSSIVPGKNIAYWLVSDTEVLPGGLHPWSRITKPSSSKRATRRATEEQIEKVSSLWDLAILLDSTLDKRLRPKFDLLQEKNKKEALEKINVVIDDVEILGCKFFSGDRAYLNISGLNSGLTAIGGEINGMCNGTGKSSILSFCSPFPTVVGKDTKSGRASALKDFFFMKDSRIIKHLTVNGVKHEHIITIKAAHTKSGGKVECYLNIEGVPQLDKGTFDEMQTMCEKLYGSYQDYLLTSFYVQPLQGKVGSSLMSANMTTIRDLVQGIAGIDRSQEKDMANAKKLEIENALNGIDIKIQYAEDNLEDKEPVLKQIEELKLEILKLIEQMNLGNKQGFKIKNELDELTRQQVANNNNKTLKNEKDSQLLKVNSEIISIPCDIENKKRSISTIEKDKEQVKTFEENKIIVDKYNAELQNYNHYKQNLDSLNSRKTTLEVKLENFIIPDAKELQEKIDSYKKDLALIETWKTDCQDVKDSNTTVATDYSNDLQDYTIARNNFDNDKLRLENKIASLQVGIDSRLDLIQELDNPCDHCGRISKSSEFKVQKSQEEIENLKTDRGALEGDLKKIEFTLTPPVKEDPTPLPPEPITSGEVLLRNDLQLCENSLSNISILEKQMEDLNSEWVSLDKESISLNHIEPPKPHGMNLDPDFIINNLKQKIENSKNVEIEINTLQNELKNAKKRSKELEIDINNISIDTEIDQKVIDKTTEINILRKAAAELQKTGAALEEQKKGLDKNILDIENEELKIQEMKNGISKQLQDKADWTEIAMLLGSNKIPALELDLKLDAIDSEATKILEPYQDGQFSFRSTTQVEGKKQAVDKFDIKIHDSISGMEKSFVEFSPGVKAVFSDAMVKALINNRNTNTYNPTIVDEADNPVNPKHIQEFYMIQENYFRQDPEMKVLIVSQCTEAKAYIENFKDIKEIRQ